MDRLIREGNPPVGQLASPVPQYKGASGWEELKGEDGASYVKDREALAKLEQVRALLGGVATEDKLEQVRVLLNTISTKDFATQTTLAAVLAKLEQLETEIQAVKANQVSGDQKVTLSGTIGSVSVVNIPAQDRVSIEPGQIYNLATVDFEGYRKIMVGVMLNVSTAAFKVHIYSHHLGGSGIFGSGVRATSHDLIRAGGEVMYAYSMEEPTWAMGQLVTVRLENVGDVPAPLRTYEIRRYA